MTSPRHRSLARSALLAEAGANPTRAQIGLAFNTLCDRLSAVLEPLFGSRAVDALFTRARHLTAMEFAELSSVLAKDVGRCRVETIDDAAALDSRAAADMLSAVLAYKIELLMTFVGEDLVMPLVRRAWPAAAAPNATNDETK